jgi:hypothetical protein
MQNKANFRKSQMNVNILITKDYDQMDTWSIGKTKPIKANSKPIQSQLKPIKSQNKPNSNPTCRGVASGEDGTCRGVAFGEDGNKPNLMLLKIALSLSRFLRYNETAMKNI